METHELRLKINAAAAKTGSREFVGAISTIKRAILELDRTSDGVFKKLRAGAATAVKIPTSSNSGLSKQRDLAIASTQSLQKATEEVTRLSERMRRLGDTRGLANLNASLNQFRVTVGGGVSSANQLRMAVLKLGESTSRAKVSLLQAEGAQRRASDSARTLATQERNAATQARRVEREMRSVAGASSAASRSLREATGSMRGLENAFSSTFQIGSAFRVMLGSITFGSFVQSVYRAGSALEQFRVTMEVATGSTAGAAKEIDFIDDMSRRLGTNLRGAREDFAKFAVSANLAGVQTKTTRDIFESVAMAMSVMGRSSEDQRLAFLALEQMLSKNVVSSEELRRQLGERLPGAVNLMARAVGVTTAELSKMLKAGQLVSSEVLPKFAKEVRAAFGPGLEAATKRASFNLGTLQVEFEKLLEIVGSSGFMAALAKGFGQLTTQLQQPEIQATVEKLGAGITDLAEIAISFATVFVDNLDTVATATKAVITGILVRQVILLGNAFVTQGQRAAIGFASLVAAMTSANAASAQNTQGITANTVSRKLNTTEVARATAGLTVFAAAQARQTAVTAASTGVISKAAGAFVGMGAVAGTTAAKLSIATRVMGGLAGPVGMAVAALSLIPLFFTGIGRDADDMATQIESAIKRTGVSFTDFEQQAVRASSSVQLNRILTDIGTLTDAVEVFYAENTAKISGLRTAIKLLNNESVNFTVGLQAAADLQSLASAFGPEAREQFKLYGNSTKQTVIALSEMSLQALDTGEGFLVLRDKIANAIVNNPSAAPVLSSLAELTENLALSELALISNKEKLVELYGTADDKLVKNFAESARAVVVTGSGLDELKSRMVSIAGESPKVRKELEAVIKGVEHALSTGQSEAAFRAAMLLIFGDAAVEVQKLRDEVMAAQQEAGAAGAAMAKTFSENINQLSKRRVFGRLVEPETVNELTKMYEQLSRFSDFAVGVDKVRSVLANYHFPTEEARAFADASLAQFEALPAAKQTYAELSRILEQNGENYPIDKVSEFNDFLRQSIRVGKDNSLSAEEFISRLKEIRSTLPSDEVNAYITKIIEAARAQSDAEADARGALQTQKKMTQEMLDSAAGIDTQMTALQKITAAYKQYAQTRIQGELEISKFGDLRDKMEAELEIQRLINLEGKDGLGVAQARAAEEQRAFEISLRKIETTETQRQQLLNLFIDTQKITEENKRNLDAVQKTREVLNQISPVVSYLKDEYGILSDRVLEVVKAHAQMANSISAISDASGFGNIFNGVVEATKGFKEQLTEIKNLGTFESQADALAGMAAKLADASGGLATMDQQTLNVYNALLAAAAEAYSLANGTNSGANAAANLAGVAAGISFSSAVAGARDLAQNLDISLHKAMRIMGIVGGVAQAARDAENVIYDPRDPRYDAATAKLGALAESMKTISKNAKYVEAGLDNTAKAAKKAGGAAASGAKTAKTATEAYADTLKSALLTSEEFGTKGAQFILQGVDGVADAVGKLATGSFDTFKDFTDSILSTFKNMLSEMIATALKNQILISLGVSQKGVGGIAQKAGGLVTPGGLLSKVFGVGGGSSSLLGSFGAGEGLAGLAGGTGLLGGAGNVIGGFASGGFSGAASGLSTALGGGFASALGGVIPVVGAAALAVSFLRKKVTELDNGLKLVATGTDVTVEAFKKVEVSRFWGLSKKVEESLSAASSEISNQVKATYTTLKDGVTNYAEALGLSGSVLSSVAKTIKISTKGMSEEEAIESLKNSFAELSDAMSLAVLGNTDLINTNETASSALARLVTALQTANASFEQLGYTLFDTSVSGASVANKFSALFGGIEAMATSTGYFYENFYSDSEKLDFVSSKLSKSMAELGLNTIPDTVSQVRYLAKAFRDAGDLEGLAAIMQAAPQLKSLIDANIAAAEEAVSLAENTLSQVASAGQSLVSAAEAAGKALIDAVNPSDFSRGIDYDYALARAERLSSDGVETAENTAQTNNDEAAREVAQAAAALAAAQRIEAEAAYQREVSAALEARKTQEQIAAITSQAAALGSKPTPITITYEEINNRIASHMTLSDGTKITDNQRGYTESWYGLREKANPIISARAAEIATYQNKLEALRSQVRALGGAPSFFGGGFTGHGARSGGVDGRGGFISVLHPNETVIDHTLATNSPILSELLAEIRLLRKENNEGNVVIARETHNTSKGIRIGNRIAVEQLP